MVAKHRMNGIRNKPWLFAPNGDPGTQILKLASSSSTAWVSTSTFVCNSDFPAVSPNICFGRVLDRKYWPFGIRLEQLDNNCFQSLHIGIKPDLNNVWAARDDWRKNSLEGGCPLEPKTQRHFRCYLHEDYLVSFDRFQGVATNDPNSRSARHDPMGWTHVLIFRSWTLNLTPM